MRRYERLCEARKAANLSQSELARRLGVTPSAVSQWESGMTKDIHSEFIFAIADMTGFSARWLATGVGIKMRASLEGGRWRKILEFLTEEELVELDRRARSHEKKS